ncbi:MAG: hypothetical protein SFU86_02745 [Pirellulaceae bacterium]|nr:hypothetical protein [Pirellulaceae bacterium]
MSPRAVFYQECPVCGRSLRLPVQYFGKAVACPHCGGEFRAASEKPREATPLPLPLEPVGLVPAPESRHVA